MVLSLFNGVVQGIRDVVLEKEKRIDYRKFAENIHAASGGCFFVANTPQTGGIMTSTLTKAEIVDNIYEKSGRNRAEVKIQVEAMLDIMKAAIKEDSSLLISGFGKFESYEKSPRKGRNPQTSESIILSGRKVVVFRISRKLRTELNPQ